MGGGDGVGVVWWSVVVVVVIWYWGVVMVRRIMEGKRIESKLHAQGIRGPTPCFWFANTRHIQQIQSQPQSPSSHPAPISISISISHGDWAYSFFPHLHRWAQQYGQIFKFSTANGQHLLYVEKPELIKELNLHKALDLGKPTHLKKLMEPMLGRGILHSNGPHWVLQRKLIAPEFFLHNVKGMLGLMQKSTKELIVRRWEREIERQGGAIVDITIDEDLTMASADILSRACFGRSYFQGKLIFSKLATMQETMSSPSILFAHPLISLLPTKKNKSLWRLKKEVETLILEVVNNREEKMRSSKNSVDDDEKDYDLLQAIIEGTDNAVDHSGNINGQSREAFIVDICKTIYFAGQEATALALTWTLMLLALYPHWQERVRAEIAHVCGDKLHECLLDLDKLRQLKTLTMVIQESLRLYGPGITISREALEDMRVGELLVPKGVRIWVLAPALHRDPENWGADANEFKPERFAGGVSEACKHPQAYLPFGMGSRICIGQTMAMQELKVVIALVLSHFGLSISPQYRHSPVYKMLLKPQYGVQLLVSPLPQPQVA